MIVKKGNTLKLAMAIALLFTCLCSPTYMYAEVIQHDLDEYGNDHVYQENGWQSQVNPIEGLFRVGNQYYMEIVDPMTSSPHAIFFNPDHIFSHNYAINRSAASGHTSEDIHSVFLGLDNAEYLEVINMAIRAIRGGDNMGVSIDSSVPDRIRFSVPSNLLGRDDLQAYSLHQNSVGYANRVRQMPNFEFVIVLAPDYNSGGVRLISAYPSSRIMTPPEPPTTYSGGVYVAPLVVEIERLLNNMYSSAFSAATNGGAWMVAQHLLSFWLRHYNMCGQGGSGKSKRDTSLASCTLPATALSADKQLPVSYTLPYHLVQEDGSAVGIHSHMLSSDELGMVDSEKEATKIIIESAKSTEPIVQSGDSVYIKIENETGESFYLLSDGTISRDSDAMFILEYENDGVKLTPKISGETIAFKNTQPLHFKAVMLKKPEDDSYPHDEF
ncbi:hypothetical protein PVK73_26210 [Bacillus thuringiensis]